LSTRISKTTVTHRYQTVIPAHIRKRYGIQEGSSLAWVDQEGEIKIIPLPPEPYKKFRGAGKGKGYLELLLESRAEERNR